MKTDHDFAEIIQSSLADFIFDGCRYPRQFVIQFLDLEKNRKFGLDTISGRRLQWQRIVDLIARFLASNVLEMSNSSNLDDAIFALKSGIAIHDPYEENNYFEWCNQDLCATPFCFDMLERHNIKGADDPLNQLFIEELEFLFEKAGVPMEKSPLIPIKEYLNP